MYTNLFIDFAETPPAKCGTATPLGANSTFFIPYTTNPLELVDAETSIVVHSDPVSILPDYDTGEDIKRYSVNGHTSMLGEIQGDILAEIADEYKGRCLYLRDRITFYPAFHYNDFYVQFAGVNYKTDSTVPTDIKDALQDYFNELYQQSGYSADGIIVGLARGYATSPLNDGDRKSTDGYHSSRVIYPALAFPKQDTDGMHSLQNIFVVKTFISIDGVVSEITDNEGIIIPADTTFEFFQIIQGKYNPAYYLVAPQDWDAYAYTTTIGDKTVPIGFAESYTCDFSEQPRRVQTTHKYYSTPLYFPKDNDLHNFTEVRYSNSKSAFGIPFDKDVILNVLLPIQVTQTQYKQNDETYEDYNGKIRILYSEITEELTMQTEYADAEWHKKMIIALSCDYFQIGTTYYFKSDEYSIDWGSTINDECMGKLAPATFKLKRQQTDRNSACW